MGLKGDKIISLAYTPKLITIHAIAAGGPNRTEFFCGLTIEQGYDSGLEWKLKSIRNLTCFDCQKWLDNYYARCSQKGIKE